MHACPTRSRLWAGVGSKRGMCEGSSSARLSGGPPRRTLGAHFRPSRQSFAPALAPVPEGVASLGGPSPRTSDGRGLPAPAVRRVPPNPHSLVCCRAPALGVKRASQMTFGTRPLGTSGRRVRRSPASRRDARFRASAVVYRSDGETADGGPAVTTRCSGCGRSPPTGGIERSRDGHGISSQSNSRPGLLLYRRCASERAIALALPTSCAGWRLGDQTPDALRWQRCRRLSSRATASAARRSDEAPGCLPARRGAQASLALGRRAP